MTTATAPQRATAARLWSSARMGVALVGAWVALTGAVLVVGFLLKGPLDGSIGAADDDFASWIAAHRTTQLTDLADAGTLLGDTIVEAVLGPLIVLGAWLLTRSARAAVFVAVVHGGELAAYLIASNVVRRDRPSVPQLDPGLVSYHSYPSGHVAAAMAMYVALAIVAWPRVDGALKAVCVALFLLPLACGAARLYEGAHHASDVLASLLYVGAWLAVAGILILRRNERGPVRSHRQESTPN